jgi:hypothetical protein
MDEYDDCDFFEDDIEEDTHDEPEPEDPEDTCDGWCFGDDIEDFAIIGGVIGYLEEEIEEKKRRQREMEEELERGNQIKNNPEHEIE